MPETSTITPPMNIVCHHEDGAQQWAKARGILDDMRKKRTTLELMGHSHKAPLPIDEDHPSSPTMTTKLGTLNEYEACEGDRAREILERMKKRRESFSQMLVGVGHASPTPTKQSLGQTESTAELSWVSSSSEEEEYSSAPYIYSEEDLSNCYDDYAYHGSSDTTTASGFCSTSSSSTGPSFYSSDGISSSSSSLISSISFQQSVMQALDDVGCYDMRYVNIPNPLTATPLSVELCSPEKRSVLDRKTPDTSRARSLYHEKDSVQQSIDRAKSHHYLRTERTGPGAVSRLRADLSAISERRSVLTSMLDTVQELKGQDIDFSVVASTILSTSTATTSEQVTADGKPPPRPTSPLMSKFVMAQAEPVSSPSEDNAAPIDFGGRWSANDARPEDHIESFGFPLSDLKWAGSGDENSLDSSEDTPVEWDTTRELEELIKDDSNRGSMYLSEASTTDASEDSPLPLHIEFTVKHTPLSKAIAEPPKALRSAEYLKALYSPRPEDVHFDKERKFGGIYHIAQLTAEVEALTDRTHIPNRRHLAKDDFLIPYNVEERFCGGLYHIASQTRPASKRALI